MKRLFLLLLCAALLVTLTGCASPAGGAYKLESITADGMRFTPSSLQMNMSLYLEEEGRGTATFSGTTVDVSWEDDGSTVTVTGPNCALEFTKSGKTLILHDNGTLLFFEPQETDE